MFYFKFEFIVIVDIVEDARINCFYFSQDCYTVDREGYLDFWRQTEFRFEMSGKLKCQVFLVNFTNYERLVRMVHRNTSCIFNQWNLDCMCKAWTNYLHDPSSTGSIERSGMRSAQVLCLRVFAVAVGRIRFG